MHEIRGPLGLIVMAAEAAKERNNDHQLQEQCESIVRTANRVLRITSSLFALIGGRSESEEHVSCPARVVRDTCMDLRALGAAVCFEIDPRALDAEVEGSSVHFEALLHSLLTNAMEHGEPAAPVEVQLCLDSDELTLRVSNRMAANTRRRGLGLGNLIVERVAAALPCQIRRAVEGDTYEVEISLAQRDRGIEAAPERLPLAALPDDAVVSNGGGRLPLALAIENLRIGQLA